MNDNSSAFPRWYPRPKKGATPRHAGQRVVAFIGVPGSGKSTLAQSFDPKAGWITITLDDLRQAIWPPHRRIYWDVRGAGNVELDHSAQRLLHAVNQSALNTALYEGFSVVLPDTHIRVSAFRRDLEIVADHGINIEWKLFKVPLEELIARNVKRGQTDPSHQVPNNVLLEAYQDLWSDEAWWRQLPSDQVEIITQGESEAA